MKIGRDVPRRLFNVKESDRAGTGHGGLNFAFNRIYFAAPRFTHAHL
jgi:predicted CDP-diglyceride synthetase/phosphatidate cytidylyltransferase